jgi:DNA helicase II / ATP-dependent DNA helicase PcrA
MMGILELTDEQRAFANHIPGAFVEACPGAGKTRAIVARIARVAPTLPRRCGIAILSFTNSAIEEFITRCHALGLNSALRHPGFVGTFDAFLRHFFFIPGGIEDLRIRPTVVDNWETLGVDICLRGRNAFAGKGVGLDYFNAENGQINPASIGHAGLRVHVQKNKAAYEQAAAQRRRFLRQKGYVSVADVRVDIVRRFQNAQWSKCLGKALASRFQEVIVDEAQDCNPLDCQVIRWLRAQGIVVTVVADPDQAIYGFRHGSPADLQAIANAFDVQDRLPLTGNFRSSPSICGFAATLRTRSVPDACLGDSAVILEPVHVVTYQGTTVSDVIGNKFSELIRATGIETKDSIILAHARKNALRAGGLGCEEDAGDSHTARFAAAVGTFWSPLVSNRAREAAVRFAERTLLDLMGKIDVDEVPSRAAERRNIDSRWLRRSALEFISRVPRTCADTNDDRSKWIRSLHKEVLRLGLVFRPGISVRRYFQDRAGANWQRLLPAGPVLGVQCATIHEAKGNEYDAVCIVIPPDRRESRRTEQLLNTWQNRTDDEAKRVIYVGITRARKLGVVAVPTSYGERVRKLLETSQVKFQVHLT